MQTEKNNETNWFYTLIGMKISNQRKALKLSQVEFATRLGLSRSSIVNIEQGRQHTPSHILWQIANILSCSIADIFPSEDDNIMYNTNPNLAKAINNSTQNNEQQKAINDFVNSVYTTN